MVYVQVKDGIVFVRCRLPLAWIYRKDLRFELAEVVGVEKGARRMSMRLVNGETIRLERRWVSATGRGRMKTFFEEAASQPHKDWECRNGRW